MYRAVLLFLMLFLLCTAPDAAQELTDETSRWFSGSGNCAFCHAAGRSALRDAAGQDVSPVHGWRASAMAHAAVDPFWQAAVRREAASHEDPAAVEDKCGTCHAPAQRTEAAQDGRRFRLGDLDALGAEGVTCTVCHQIRDEGLGTEASYSGHYVIDGEADEIFGPYENPVQMPMWRHVEYRPVYGPHVEESALCGTCHALFIAQPDADSRQTRMVAEQTTYLEWRASDWARGGVSCQDCHMPVVEHETAIARRPPWLDARERVWKHEFAGANRHLLALKDITQHASAAHREGRLERVDALLRSALEFESDLALRNDSLVGRIVVHNRSGHRLPTGIPYRRMWLRLRLSDGEGRLLFAGGEHPPPWPPLRADQPPADAASREADIRNMDAVNAAVPGGAAHSVPSREAVSRTVVRTPDDLPVYEAVMMDRAACATDRLLAQHGFLSDTRILPKGYAERAYDTRAAGTDTIRIAIPLGMRCASLRVEASMLYQPFADEVIDTFIASSQSAALTSHDSTPAVMRTHTIILAPEDL